MTKLYYAATFKSHVLTVVIFIISPYGSMVGILSLLCICLFVCTVTDFSAAEKIAA